MKIRVFEIAKDELNNFLSRQFEKGIKKYGTPLMTFNGRDAFDDGMQEVVDLVMYFNQFHIERNRLCELLYYGIDPTEEEKEYIEKYGKVK